MSYMAPIAVHDATSIASNAYEMPEESNAKIQRFGHKKIKEADKTLKKQ